MFPGRRWVFWLLPGLLVAADLTPEQTEFFEKKIRPVLATSCYGCHNSKSKTAMGGLRLDSREGLLQGGDSGKAIMPGDPSASKLVQAVSYQHELKMPPSGRLSEAQIADLAAWVKMGAPDPRSGSVVTPPVRKGYDFAESKKFWAFQPVGAAAPPPVRDRDWVRSPVDAFILSKLAEHKLRPAAPAGKRALLRRVTQDLTGLPPSPAELDAFLQDQSPDAFEKVVDRLLASPHYGERWARHWLDLMRYAETNGHEYDNDKLDPWRYRDYVIRAFNEDIRYDQFVREHIAGDLLPARRLRADRAAVESPLGTTSLWFNEVLNSATDSDKSRADDVDNQIDVASKAFLGLTVACARCHDHKFDPIPTADYYALAGVLHSTGMREAAIDSPDKMARIEYLSSKIRQINREIESLSPRHSPHGQKAQYRRTDRVYQRFEDSTYAGWVPQGIAFGTQPSSGMADSRAAGSEVFSGTLTSPIFKTGKELFLHVRVGGTKADPKLKERGPLRFTIVADGYKGQHIVPDGSPLHWKTLRLTFERERKCYFEIVDRSRDGHIIVDEIVFSELETPPSVDGPSNSDGDYLSANPESEAWLLGLRAQKSELEAKVPDSEFAMVAEDREYGNTRLHIRGNHKNLGEEVPRRSLQVIAGEQQKPVTAGSGRPHIAEWMASEKNPLTARVMVNRIWKHHFGNGIVRSTDNFGKMGEAPTHPELLDFLAAEFMKGGWSIKAMHRLLVLSNSYRMSSASSPEANAADPGNKLLQHMPVQRLEAEAIRDGMLAVSGSLSRKLFGPSIVPHISAYQEGRGKPLSGPLERRRPAQHLRPGAPELHDSVVPRLRLSGTDQRHRQPHGFHGPVAGAHDDEQRIRCTAGKPLGDGGDRLDCGTGEPSPPNVHCGIHP